MQRQIFAFVYGYMVTMLGNVFWTKNIYKNIFLDICKEDILTLVISRPTWRHLTSIKSV